MHNVTFIITAHERPVFLRRLLRSIREFYPDIKILITADGKITATTHRAIEAAGARLVWYPDKDLGVSRLRNEAVSRVDDDYAMMLEDDFIFTKETKIERMKAVLEKDKNIALCCGPLYYNGKLQWFANRLNLDYERKFYETITIREPDWKEAGGVRYFEVDYAFNFFLLRVDSGLKWDEELKTAIEHIDFFIRLKREGIWKAAFTPEVAAIHHCKMPSKKYRKDRTRYIFWERFYKKHGFRHGINGAEHCVYDLVNRRALPYPEYVFYLLKHYSQPGATKRNQTELTTGGQNG